MNYQAMIEQIKLHEGLRLKPYKCTEGFITIGYGRNLITNGITENEAEQMLLADLAKIESSLEGKRLLIGHNSARKAVIINMAYQLGVTGLLSFKRMLKAFIENDYETASKEMLNSKWSIQTPNRASELSDQMRTGEFQ